MDRLSPDNPCCQWPKCLDGWQFFFCKGMEVYRVCSRHFQWCIAFQSDGKERTVDYDDRRPPSRVVSVL